jgi:hypothetical protein
MGGCGRRNVPPATGGGIYWTGTTVGNPTTWYYGCAQAQSMAATVACSCVRTRLNGIITSRLPFWSQLTAEERGWFNYALSQMSSTACGYVTGSGSTLTLPPGFLANPPSEINLLLSHGGPAGVAAASLMSTFNQVAQCLINLPAALMGMGLECLVEHASQITIYHGVIEGGPADTGTTCNQNGSQYVQCTRMADAPVCSNSSAGMPCLRGGGQPGTCGTGFGGCACR